MSSLNNHQIFSLLASFYKEVFDWNRSSQWHKGSLTIDHQLRRISLSVYCVILAITLFPTKRCVFEVLVAPTNVYLILFIFSFQIKYLQWKFFLSSTTVKYDNHFQIKIVFIDWWPNPTDLKSTRTRLSNNWTRAMYKQNLFLLPSCS